MKIAMIGTGNVGGNLGRRLLSSGYDVVFGVRNLEGTGLEKDAQVALVADAVAEASVVFLAVPGGVAVQAIKDLELEDKILVDCTNPIRWDEGPVWDPPKEGSNAQAIAAATKASVVKAFNTFGAEFHGDPETSLGGVDVQIASDDDAAVAVIREIAEGAGFHIVPSGGLRNAGLLENLAVLWIHLALVEKGGRERAFKLVSR